MLFHGIFPESRGAPTILYLNPRQFTHACFSMDNKGMRDLTFSKTHVTLKLSLSSGEFSG